MSNFLTTQDEETAKKLESLGYKMLQKNGNMWTFLNDAKLNFSDDIKVVKSNKMVI